MLKSKYDWKFFDISDYPIQQLAQKLNFPTYIIQLLANRGITEEVDIQHFLEANLDHLHDPFLLLGMEKAVDRIYQAKEKNEKVLICGDYDCDGVTSTMVMIQLLEALQISYEYHIPDRFKEGYGMHKHVVENTACTLIITVDTGITAVDPVEVAKQRGIDVIITDHHEPPEKLPDAFTIINPKQISCSYPFKFLAGVGIALKLYQACLKTLTPEVLQLAALGTIADLMPLVDENRVIVKFGLHHMRQIPMPGLKALAQEARIAMEQINEEQISFGLAPRMNAAGRIAHADVGISLLQAKTISEAQIWARQMESLNQQRQELVEKMTEEALQMVDEKYTNVPSIIILAKQTWNLGVVGIVAARVLEKYNRPVFILGEDQNTKLWKGSARSFPQFDLYKALCQCEKFLDHFGGHQAAAGVGVSHENLSHFEAEIQSWADKALQLSDFKPMLEIDMECSLKELSYTFIEQLNCLAPFGVGNPKPVVLIKDAKCMQLKLLGNQEQHLKIFAQKESKKFEVMGFRQSVLYDELNEGLDVDMVGVLGINEWNFQRKIQLLLKDCQIPYVQVFDQRDLYTQESFEVHLKNHQSILDPSLQIAVMAKSHEMPSSNAHVLFIYEWIDDFDFLEACRNLERIYVCLPRQKYKELPTRKDCVQLYQFLKGKKNWIENDFFWQQIEKQIGLSTHLIKLAYEMFKDLDFIALHNGEVMLHTHPKKKDLFSAPSYLKHLFHYGSLEQLREYMRNLK